MQEVLGKRAIWVLPQTMWRRPRQRGLTGPLPGLLLLLRASSSLLPSCASKLLKPLKASLFQSLGFHDAQGQSILINFSVEKNDLAHAFLLKQLMCHLSQECIHCINLCCEDKASIKGVNQLAAKFQAWVGRRRGMFRSLGVLGHFKLF